MTFSTYRKEGCTYQVMATIGNFDALLTVPKRRLDKIWQKKGQDANALTIFTPEEAAKSFKSDCLSTFERYTLAKRPKLLLELVLGGLAGTVTNCSDRIAPGMYHPSNALAFYLEAGDSQKIFRLRDRLFSDSLTKNHRQVATLHQHDEDPETFVVSRFNIYASKAVVTQVWTRERPFALLDFVFADFRMQARGK